jgi:hypothetical protein
VAERSSRRTTLRGLSCALGTQQFLEIRCEQAVEQICQMSINGVVVDVEPREDCLVHPTTFPPRLPR